MLRNIARSVRWVPALAVILSITCIGQVSAQMSSNNYKVNEAQFGSGSSLNDCSANYCAKTSVGDLTNGSAASTNYSAQLGFNTSDEPMLEITTSAGLRNLGVLNTSETASTSYEIGVRSYLSKGYVMQITGSPPKNNGRVLTRLISQSTVQPGTEQFGINLADNSTPDVGAGPIQMPDGTFSFGTVASDYTDPNLFKYLDGDIVASTETSSGLTTFTMSMILNISDTTPGGKYVGSLSAVVTPTY